MISFVDISESAWAWVKQAARNTVSREGAGKPASSEWKRKILLAEHSPIRQLRVRWCWQDLPYWVSVHFVRHKIGIEHWVSTQRTDRTGEQRDDKPQDAPVMHMAEADAQAMINISRKRLCSQASPETRKAWREVLEGIRVPEPELYSVCVPECVYRGFCPEMHSCGYAETDEYERALEAYRNWVSE